MADVLRDVRFFRGKILWTSGVDDRAFAVSKVQVRRRKRNLKFTEGHGRVRGGGLLCCISLFLWDVDEFVRDFWFFDWVVRDENAGI